MNILIFTSSDSSFNSLRPETEMFLNFHGRGHNVTIITQADTEYGRIYREQGIRVIDCHPKRKICFDSIRTVREELHNQQYDILYATNSKSIPNAAFAAIGSRVKLVTYRGTTGGLYRHDPSAYLTHLHPRVDGIVCVSDAVRDDVRKKVWKNRDKVVTIHKGHDLDWYDNPSADLGEFGIGDKDFTLICAVNARPSKGIPVLLEAVDRLADIENIHLLLAGKNMDQYIEIIASNRLKDRIHVLGYRHDVPELIKACDVLVQPSVSGEGLPRAVMESMAYGTTPIATTTGGGKEVIEEGVSGYIVPTHDAAAIEAKIRILYQDPEKLSAMGQNARERIRRDFSCERSTDLCLAFFNSLL